MKKSAESYLEKGRAEIAAGKYEKARKAFTKAIKLDHNNAQAYYERGMVVLNHWLSNESYDDFVKALELDPSIGEAYWGIARSYAQEGLPIDDDILELMTKYVELRPSDPLAYHERAYIYYMTGQHESAIKDLSIAIDMNPDGIDDYYYQRGRAYNGLGKYEEAISDFSRAICIDPKNPESYLRRGRSYACLLKFDLAIQDFTTAIKMDKKMVKAYDGRGTCYFEMGRYHDAIEDFNMVEKLDKSMSSTDPYRGFCYNKLGEHHQAIKELDAVIWSTYQRFGLYYEDFQARGDSHGALGDFDKRNRDHKIAKFLMDLAETAPEKIRELKYDLSTGTIMFDDAA